MVLSLLLAASLAAQSPGDTLYAVDLYGLRAVPEAFVRDAIGLRPGDPLPASLDSVRRRVREIQGVDDVDVSAVCCSEDGRTTLYVGIREMGSPPLTFRPPPTGGAELPPYIVEAGVRVDSAWIAAVWRGASAEDRSQGYALAEDSALRAAQSAFLDISARDSDTLIRVLHEGSDPVHRALAAEILAYSSDRQRVLSELLYAAGDPDEGVRNNAVRALALLAGWLTENSPGSVSIPAAPFLDFINSVSWTDRNKGVMVLMILTQSRDAAILGEVRARGLDALVEMARWSNRGHALGPFLILARLAGVEEGEAFHAWQEGEREAIIARARKP